jgi:hypothetical protein
MPRASKATVAQRVEQVLQIVLLGGELADLRNYATEKKWHVSDSQLYRYQQRAMELCVAQRERDREKLFARMTLQLRAIYARAMEGGDLRVARAVLRDEADLFGLGPRSNAEIAEEVEDLRKQVEAYKNGRQTAPSHRPAQNHRNGHPPAHADAERV